MIMVGAGVEMGGDEDLMILAPHPFRQLHAHLMTELRRDLAGLEALVGVVGHVAPGLAEALLHSVHLLKGTVPAAVDPGDIQGFLRAVFRLFPVGRVVEHGLQVGVLGLGRIAGIIHHTA